MVTAYDVYDLEAGQKVGSLSREDCDTAVPHGDYLYVDDRQEVIHVYDKTLTPVDVEVTSLYNAYDEVDENSGCHGSLLIFTKKNDPQLPRYIMEQLDRGVTSWTGRGGWTGDEVQVLCVCLSKYEIDTLQDVLHRVDPDAFYIVQEGVHAGGNFERHLG